MSEKDKLGRRNVLKTLGAVGVVGSSLSSVSAQSNSGTDPAYTKALKARKRADGHTHEVFVEELEEHGYGTSVSSISLDPDTDSDDDFSGEEVDLEQSELYITLSQPCDYEYTWVDLQWVHDTTSGMHHGENPLDVVSIFWDGTDYGRSNDTSYGGPYVYGPEDGSGTSGALSPTGIAFEHEDAMLGGDEADEDYISSHCGIRLIKENPDHNPEQRLVNVQYDHHWSSGSISVGGISASGPSIDTGWQTEDDQKYDSVDETSIESDCDHFDPA